MPESDSRYVLGLGVFGDRALDLMRLMVKGAAFPRRQQTGYVAAEDATNANALIADFKEKDYDNGYNSYGYCYVGSDDVIKELSADRKGFILQEIH